MPAPHVWNTQLTHKQPLQHSRTKTVATVGPACDSPEMLGKLLHAGANVFRINMAHGSRESHTQAVKNIRTASSETGMPAGILVDLAGPKIRLGQLTQNPLALRNGQQVKFVRGTKSNADDELTCIYEPLIDEVALRMNVSAADPPVKFSKLVKVPLPTSDHLNLNASAARSPVRNRN